MSQAPQSDVETHERDGYVEVQYLGSYSLDRFKKQMERSTLACVESRKTLLLVDITHLEGYTPTTYERHEIGIHGAAMSRTLDKVAVVGTMDQVGRDQYAGTVARNRGAAVQVFMIREEAIRWLLTPASPPKA